MLELTRALTAWLHADTELRQAQAQTLALNDYGRGYQDGLTDADNFYIECEEDCDEDCDCEDTDN